MEMQRIDQNACVCGSRAADERDRLIERSDFGEDHELHVDGQPEGPRRLAYFSEGPRRTRDSGSRLTAITWRAPSRAATSNMGSYDRTSMPGRILTTSTSFTMSPESLSRLRVS
jgi:hypothetical protein